jgi:hypothetical protein
MDVNHDSNQDLDITNLLNLFIIYYKRKLNINNGLSMFDGILRSQINLQTNQMLEEFYEHLQEYKVAKYQVSIKYNEDILNSTKELDFFILKINNENILMSDSLISLMIDINNDYNDNDWEIID